MSSIAPALTLHKIPSGDDVLVGRLFTPEGESLHPTVVLLHGFPGTQLNFDIASALQRVGFAVLIFHYRGAWGSQGTFSFEHALEDVQAALAYLRQPEVAQAHRIDVERLALVGHSMGGFLAIMTASQDQGIKSVASLSGFNFGMVAGVLVDKPEQHAAFQAMLDDSAFFLAGATGESLIEQSDRYAEDWNLITRVQSLGDRPLLLVGAKHDDVGPVAGHHDPLVGVLDQSGASQFEHFVLDTGHNYDDHRTELTELVLNWLMRAL